MVVRFNVQNSFLKKVENTCMALKVCKRLNQSAEDLIYIIDFGPIPTVTGVIILVSLTSRYLKENKHLENMLDFILLKREGTG